MNFRINSKLPIFVRNPRLYEFDSHFSGFYLMTINIYFQNFVQRPLWDWEEQFSEQDIALFYNPLYSGPIKTPPTQRHCKSFGFNFTVKFAYSRSERCTLSSYQSEKMGRNIFPSRNQSCYRWVYNQILCYCATTVSIHLWHLY